MATKIEETVGFRRRPDLPGVEVRDVENSGRRWRCFATGYEFLAPRTWQGEILHRRRQQAVTPGMAFCAYPEEVFTTPRILSVGGGSAATIDPEVFHGYLAEHDLAPDALDLRSFVRMSKPLSTKMRRLFHLLRPSTPSLELQSSLVDLVAGLVDEAVAKRQAIRPVEANSSAAGRIRECLHFETGRPVDLERLAQWTSLSRFQVLRVFKQKYGLPPHAYQLRVRIGRAQRALLAGLPPADVAVDQGFVDQSHLSRHFKQLVGVTPVAYARALQ
jgi:AraC-like DNA-binding protein